MDLHAYYLYITHRLALEMIKVLRTLGRFSTRVRRFRLLQLFLPRSDYNRGYKDQEEAGKGMRGGCYTLAETFREKFYFAYFLSTYGS
jgi:hypothetical protein